MTLINRGPGRGCGFTTPRARRAFKHNRPEPRLPEKVDGADWQAGVTIESWKFKIHLDGEPCKNAVAAARSWVGFTGWVDVRSYGDKPDGTSDPLAAATRRIYGLVEIVPGDDDE